MSRVDSHPPRPVPRPAFARWMWERSLELKAVAAEIGCSHEQVRLICLPFADRRRRVPTAELLERIVTFTDGEIRPADFYPPHLNGGMPSVPFEATP
ncbi:MAG TPA: hypothetical protein VGH15_05710 [Caulobacteraceae bacterium]|jgi:hypothetical protein